MLRRARQVLALALLCAGAFFVPFGVMWWLEREHTPTNAQPAPTVEPSHLPSSYPGSSGSALPELPEQSEPVVRPPIDRSVPLELNAVEFVSPSHTVDQPPVLIDEIRDVLSNSFYLPVSDAALQRPSVGQIIDAVGDPYTEYLSPSEFAKAREESGSTYEGVGLLVGASDLGLIVTSALKGPARDAGIRPGDTIVSIDGKPVHTLSFDRAISLFRGERGSIVTLMIERPGEEEPMVARVVRELITTPAVRVRILNTPEQNLGYVRLLTFPADAGEQVRDAVSDLLDQGVEGIVLDLRGNPGGYLQEAIEVASVFLKSGIICSTEGLHRLPEVYTATGDALAGDLPLVTLVDGQSASAAEIVAAAMRENLRGRLVGVPTFGKASIQSIVPLANGGGLRLTTAMYLTPAGNRIAGEGARPHVEALDDPLTRRDEALRKARAVLAGLIERRHDPPVIHF